MRKFSVLLIFVIAFAAAVPALATPIGFSAAEGYAPGDLDGQPNTGQDWSCTTNNTYNIFNVVHGTNAHADYLSINLSAEHGVMPNMATVDYATMQTETITGEFTASFSIYFSLYADDLTDETVIALGQSADSDWGVYLGMNKTSGNSMAYHNGTEWVEISTGLSQGIWFDVEIVGDVDTGLFSILIYDEELRSAVDPLAGLIADVSSLEFRDDPTELNYVMLSNEGSSQDTGAYHHLYDDLGVEMTGATVPEPGTILMLIAGAAGMTGVIRRKK